MYSVPFKSSFVPFGESQVNLHGKDIAVAVWIWQKDECDVFVAQTLNDFFNVQIHHISLDVALSIRFIVRLVLLHICFCVLTYGAIGQYFCVSLNVNQRTWPSPRICRGVLRMQAGVAAAQLGRSKCPGPSCGGERERRRQRS